MSHDPTNGARKAYDIRQGIIGEQIATLQALLEAHDPGEENTNWAHVGDLGRVKELLKEATRSIASAAKHEDKPGYVRRRDGRVVRVTVPKK